MAEIVSAFAGHFRSGRFGANQTMPGVVLSEVRSRDLVQVGAWRDTVDAVKAKLATELAVPVPANTRRATTANDITLMMVGPDKLWVAAPVAAGLHLRLSKRFATSEAVVTELGHSRTVLRIAGTNAADLIARLMPIDLHASVFPVGSFAASGIHGIGALLHFVGEAAGHAAYDLYLPRTFALSIFEAIAELAEQWGCQIEG